MVFGIKTNAKHKSFGHYKHAFNKYHDGLINLRGRVVTVKGKGGRDKEIEAFKAASKLLYAYKKVSLYLKLKDSDHRLKMELILSNKEFKNQFPLKRYQLKIRKLMIDLMHRIRVVRGKLKTPDSVTPPKTPSLSEVPKEGPQISFSDLIKKIGIQDGAIVRLGKDGIYYCFRKSHSNPYAVTIEGMRNSIYRLQVDEDQILMTKFEDHQKVVLHRIPFAEASLDKILEIISNKHESNGLKSHARRLLDKLGSKDGRLLTTWEAVNCYMEKSPNENHLVIHTDNLEKRGQMFRLGFQEEKVILEKLSLKGDDIDFEIIHTTDFEKLSLEEILNLTTKTCGLSKAANPETVVARMMASVDWQQGDYYLNAQKRGLNLEKPLKEQPKEALEAFLDYYDPKKKLHYDLNISVQELIKVIQDSKYDGLSPKQTYAAFNQLLTEYQQSNPKNREFFEILLQRMREKYSFEWTCRRKITENLKTSPKTAAQMADLEALRIIYKASLPEYQNIGVFVTAGWQSHHINLEVRKVKDIFGKEVFQIVVANAGAGSSINRKSYELNHEGNAIAKERNGKYYGITTKIYHADLELAQSIIKKVLLLKCKKGGKSTHHSRDFNKIFEKAVSVENYSIPERSFQKLGNCAIKSNLEGIFLVAQRLGKVSEINDFIKFMNEGLKDFADQYHYAALKESLEPKAEVKPLDTGYSVFILQDSNKNTYIFPNGRKDREFTMGLKGAVTLNPATGGMSRQQAVLVNQKERYYMSRHSKGNKSNRVAILRKGKLILVDSKKIEIEEGDKLLVGDCQLEASFKG